MKNFIEIILSAIFSGSLVLIAGPFMRAAAKKIGLVDKPNARKVHHTPIPLVGGILVFSATLIVSLISPSINISDPQIKLILLGGLVMLVIGVIDDRLDVAASLKLVIQIALAYYAFDSGVRIESMYGIFGVYELPLPVQYVLTMVVIAGCVNAFNLTDGIDGLASGLAILGFGAFTALAIILGQYQLVILFVTIIGALLGFLRYNLSKNHKIFMGDAGSLFLGYILVLSGIMLIQAAQKTDSIKLTLISVIGVLAIPVADSLRVYRNRIKEGNSPFKADKTHLHHLVLDFGVKHIAATIIIVIMAIVILLVSIFIGTYLSLTITLLILVAMFGLFSRFLAMNKQVNTWREKIHALENK